MHASAPTIVPDIVEEHFHEAAFLYCQWERSLTSPSHSIADVADGPEERLIAHLSGLTLGGDGLYRDILLPALAGADRGEAFAAAAALAMTGRLVEIGADVADAVTESAFGPTISHALALALPGDGERALLLWLREGRPALRAVAMEVLSFRRSAPADSIASAAVDGAPRLAAAAVRASGYGDDFHRGRIEFGLTSAEHVVRDVALRTALRLGLQSGLAAARRVVDSNAPSPEAALEILAFSGDREDLDRIGSALKKTPLQRAAIWAAGLSGSPLACDLCLPFLDDPNLGRFAFEALSHVGGSSIARLPSLDRDADGGDEWQDDEVVTVHGPEAELPIPDADLVTHAWQQLRFGLVSDRRYLGGEPITPERLLRAFTHGPARRRPALELELAARTHGQYRIETQSWAREQLRAQASSRFAPRADVARPLSRVLRP